MTLLVSYFEIYNEGICEIFDQPESGEDPEAKKKNLDFDLQIMVGDAAFTCSRELLCHSSEFFKALLNSGMKEQSSRQVALHTISLDMFQVILHFITTGNITLTNENVVEVWSAADFLQMPALIKTSEMFVVANISLKNWEEAYDLAEQFASNVVKMDVFQFALNNFNELCEDEKFLRLSYAEVMDIISSEDLVVKTEDLVLSFIKRWVSYSQNTNSEYQDQSHKNLSDLTNQTFKEEDSSQNEQNRIVHLLPLIKASRYYLISEEYLNQLIETNHLVKYNGDISSLIFKALAHKNDHGYYPSPAQHRSSSELVHAAVVVMEEEADVKAYSLRDSKWYDLPLCPDLKYVDAMTVFDNELFILGVSSVGYQSALLVLRNNSWLYVLSMPFLNNVYLLSHGRFIYAFHRFQGQVHRFDPTNPSLHVVSSLDVPMEQELKHVMSFGNEILLFFSDSDWDEATCVYGFNVNSDQCVRYDNISGPAEYIASFRSDDSHYVLQSDGTFSNATKTLSETLVFTVQHNRMPDRGVNSNEMCGCFIYKDTFYVHDDQLNWDVGYAAIPGIFSNAVHLPVRDCATSFAHCDLPAEVLAVQSTCAVLH